MASPSPKTLEQLVPLGTLQELANALTALADVPMYFATPDGHLLTHVEGLVGACARFAEREDVRRPCLSCDRTRLARDGRRWPAAPDLGAARPCPSGLQDLALPLLCDGRAIGLLASVQFVTDPAMFEVMRRRLASADVEDSSIEGLRESVPFVDAARVTPLASAARTIADLVVALASRALRAREDARAAEVLATSDSLTGVANRRKAERELDGAISLAKRRGRPFAVVLLDLDHFKRVNDTQGHPSGDRLLVAFTRLVERNIRPSDRLFRVGGDEFLILCHETNRAEVDVVAERVRRAVGTHLFQLPGPRTITTSVGVVAWERGPVPSRDALAEAIDAALYVAKDGGGDRVAHGECPAASDAEDRSPAMTSAG